jgi:hypothetical protein
MKSSGKLIFALLLSILMSSCAATLQNLQNLVTSPAEHYRELALAYEKEDELQQAIFYWEVVAHLNPKDPDAPKIIKTLEHATVKAAQVH